jgi:hypothetical protein
MNRYSLKTLREKWCQATVADAVKLFHEARRHPDNEAELLEDIARRCANSAFQYVAETIVGDKELTAKRYGEMCYERFRKEIQQVVMTEVQLREVEEAVC